MNDKHPAARVATDRAHSTNTEFHVTLDGIPIALGSWDLAEQWWVLTNIGDLGRARQRG